MASKPRKKKVVVTTSSTAKTSLKATRSKGDSSDQVSMIFNKENYKWMAIGVGLIAIGMLLMIGGYNEDPSVWNEDKIYGFQRTLLAPVVILTGLVVEVYAIFK